MESFGNRSGNLGRYSLGCIVGIKSGIQTSEVYKDEYSCFLLAENKVIIFAYLPPKLSNTIFLHFLSKLSEVTSRYVYHNVILMGDLNSRIGSLQNIGTANLNFRVS